MATDPNVTDLFRYFVVRDHPITTAEERNVVEVGSLSRERSPLRERLDGAAGDPGRQRELATQHAEAGREAYESIRQRVRPVYDALLSADKVTVEEISASVEQVLGRSGTGLEETDDPVLAISHTIEDMVLAWSINAPSRPEGLDEAVRFLRFWYVGTTLRGRALLPDRFEDALSRVVIVLPKTIRGVLVAEARFGAPGEPRQTKPRQDRANPEKLQREIVLLSEAVRSVEEGIRTGSALEVLEDLKEEPVVTKPTSRINLWGRRRAPVLTRVVGEVQQRFNPRALRDVVRDTIGSFIDGAESLPGTVLLERLGDKLAERQRTLTNLFRQARTWLHVGNMLVRRPTLDDLAPAPRSEAEVASLRDTAVSAAMADPMVYYAGVADLKIVREKLVAYELADIAHIENVLAGEIKERTHRRLEARETEEVALAESEEETERDTQSTTKNELATESSTVAKDTVKVEGNLTVSGSYGPSLDFSASASGASSSETTNSTKRSAAFAQEVVEKTIEKVRKRILEQRRIRLLSEVEETNLHGVRNAYPGAAHVRGVYRWLNKIMEAQVYNYGARHMFSFVVPEPATFYLWSLGRQGSASIQEPVAPWFTAQGLDRHNYQDLAATFGASGVKAPPDYYQTVTKVFKHDPPIAADWLSNNLIQFNIEKYIVKFLADSLVIPDGYTASFVNVHIELVGGVPNFVFDIGNLHQSSPTSGQLDSFQGEIGVGAKFYDVLGYLIYFDVKCYLDPGSGTYKQWQNDTFQAILEGYQRQLSQYEEKLAAAAIQQGIAIPGRNPLENAETIRNELKRASLSMFLWTDRDAINAFRLDVTDPTSADYWRIDYDEVPRLGQSISFFERAFEWENMTYVFFPYFHGRFGEWSRRIIELADPDSNMAAFLKAGAARVLVPVRPEWAEALLQYAERGYVAQGMESLLTAEDAVQALIAEVRNRGADSVPNALPEGDPWEVRLPTTLVLLQDPNVIEFRDVLYGDRQGRTKVDFDYPVPSRGAGNSGDTTAAGRSSGRAARATRARKGETPEDTALRRDVRDLLAE